MNMRVKLLFIFLLLVTLIFAQPVRTKPISILSCETVWMSNSVVNAGEFDLQFYQTMVDEYIKLPNYEYHTIPVEDVQDIKNEALQVKSVNAQNLAKMFETKLAPRIIQVLSDTELQRIRNDNYPEERQIMQLIEDKSELFGLSEDFISQLLHAEFIFLPFVSNVKKNYRNSINKYELEGGIVWYKIHFSTEGVVRLVHRQSDVSKSTGRADASKPERYGSFTHGDYAIQTTPEEFAMYDAIRKLVFALERKMKTMPDFARVTQIAENKNDKEFRINMGLREGIHLDDGFHIMRFWEENDGKLLKSKAGYARIVKTANNKSLKNHDAKSLAKAYYSQPQLEKIYLVENPRSGLDFSIWVGPRFGLKVPKAATEALSSTYIIDKDIKNAFEFGINFSYNLAPIIDFSQLYYDFEVGYGLPTIDYSTNSTNTSAHTLSFYTGLSKKIWFGRHAAILAGKIGYDRISIKATRDNVENAMAANALGAKLSLGYSYMMSPNWQLFAIVDYKAATAPIASHLSNGGNDINLSGSLKDAHDKITVGGTQIKLGISYALGFNPFNISGWLDRYKKY